MSAITLMTTDELMQELNGCRDSLRRLQKAEPTWRRQDRERGLGNIQALHARCEALVAELCMAKGGKS